MTTSRISKQWRPELMWSSFSGANELKLQITIKTEKTVQELKQAIAEKADAPADRQRLIYSGKVLKVRFISSVPIFADAHTNLQSLCESSTFSG